MCFKKSDVFIMHSVLCKKIIPTAHKNDEMTQLQRVCTPSSCLLMIAYLTSPLKNVRELEEFFLSVAVQANMLFPRYIYIIEVSSKVLNVHSRVQIFRRANHSFHYLSGRQWILNSPGNLASQFKYPI